MSVIPSAASTRDTYDVAVARRVAAACGQRHHVIALGPEFRAALPHYFERAVHISDGYLGLSGAAELYANSQARLLAPVRITGNYGGELLRGDGGRNAAILNERLLTPEFSRVLGDLKRDYMETLAASAIPSALFQQTSWLGYGRYRIEQSQLLPRTPFLDNDLVDLVLAALPDRRAGRNACTAVLERHKRELLAIPTDRGFLPARASVSGAVRRLYQEAVFKGEYWVSHGAPHMVAALASLGASSRLERYFLGRHKFYHLRTWLRTDLSTYVRDQLTHKRNSALNQFFDLPHLALMVDAHLKGRKNHLHEIDQALTLSITNQLLLSAGVGRVDNAARTAVGLPG